jgi:hypothetical protein
MIAFKDYNEYAFECFKGTLVYVAVQCLLLLFCLQVDKAISLDLRDLDTMIQEDYVGMLLKLSIA